MVWIEGAVESLFCLIICVQVIISEVAGELAVTVLDEEAIRCGGVATFPLVQGSYPRLTHQWLQTTLPQLR